MQTSHNQQRPLEVELVLPVKTYDIDFAGIVSNIVYIRWLEDLRLEILDAYLPLQKMLEDGANSFTEVGPGNVLQGLVKKVDRTVETKSATLS